MTRRLYLDRIPPALTRSDAVRYFSTAKYIHLLILPIIIYCLSIPAMNFNWLYMPGNSPNTVNANNRFGLAPVNIREYKTSPESSGIQHPFAISNDSLPQTESSSSDQPPELIWLKMPDIKNKVQITQWEVTLRILIDKTGKPVRAVVLSENPLNAGIGALISQSIISAIFSPGLKDGIPVQCWVNLPIRQL
jgi:hypothetical protein